MQKGSIIIPAHMVLFFLLLSPVSPQCRAGTAQECQMALPFVPGLDYASTNIDITELLRKKIPVMNLQQTPVGTCTVCDNLLQNKLQRLPLAITNWTANILCQQKVQHSVLQSVVSVAMAMSELLVKNDWKIGLDVEVNSSANFQRVLSGSHSDFISFAAQSVSRDKHIFVLHHVSCSYYKFSIDKNRAVTDHFKNKVKALPEKYNQNSKQKYYDLISEYGTHFITEFDLGAAVWTLTALPECRIELENITSLQIRKCLEIEVGYIIGFEKVTRHADFQQCKEILKDLTRFWIGQLRYIIGGNVYHHNDFLNNALNDPKDWLGSVVSEPGVFSYSVSPLHNLVNQNDPRWDSLKKAVSEYVSEKTLWRNCTHSCPEGVKQTSWDPCTCECPNDNFTNSMCCPHRRGLARLTVDIERAIGLWGDYITATDAYVKVIFKGKVMCTPTIWNNNNPIWKARLDFGIIQVTEDFSHIDIEVWDEDLVESWDDLLGKCVVFLESWNLNSHNCDTFHRGTLHYKYFLECGPGLGGPTCRNYLPLFHEK